MLTHNIQYERSQTYIDTEHTSEDLFQLPLQKDDHILTHEVSS